MKKVQTFFGYKGFGKTVRLTPFTWHKHDIDTLGSEIENSVTLEQRNAILAGIESEEIYG